MNKEDILFQYQNGNTDVTILSDGTKIREFEDSPIIVHPESIDVKITNYCDLGCAYCHENSTTKGKEANLDKLKEVLLEVNFPGGIELAIGGGNPLSHSEIVPFLEWLKSKGFIANLTVNQGHIKEYFSLLEHLIVNDLVKGLGVSITNNDLTEVKELSKLTRNIVFHVIVGLLEPSLVDELIKFNNSKLLLLGYKQFGRGINFFSNEVKENINLWYRLLPRYIGKAIISFDNLAIDQLNVRRLFTDKGWEKFYMGDDFTFTMYIDAVNQEFSPTSRNKERFSFDDYTLLEFFNLKDDLKVPNMIEEI